MPKYKCLYCSKNYQVHRKNVTEGMLCGQCGDPLVNIPLVSVTKLVALLAALAFLAPLILMVFTLFDAHNKQPPRQNISISMGCLCSID